MDRKTLEKAMELNTEIDMRRSESSSLFNNAMKIVSYEENMRDYQYGCGEYPEDEMTITIRVDLLDDKCRNTLYRALTRVGKHHDDIREKLEKELEEL